MKFANGKIQQYQASSAAGNACNTAPHAKSKIDTRGAKWPAGSTPNSLGATVHFG